MAEYSFPEKPADPGAEALSGLERVPPGLEVGELATNMPVYNYYREPEASAGAYRPPPARSKSARPVQVIVDGRREHAVEVKIADPGQEQPPASCDGKGRDA